MREVFEHPTRADLVIKTIRPDRVDGRGQFISWKRKKPALNRKFGLYVSFAREIRETIRAAKNFWPETRPQFPFAWTYGLVLTPNGLGLVVEKITSADGSLAPTLGRMVKEGKFTPEHQRRLDAFFEICAARHIVVGDLHASNLVYCDRDGGRFVLVDGLGEKAFLPVHELFASVNRMKLERAQKELRGWIERRGISASNSI